MTDDLIWKSAHELSQLYRNREVSPVEVVEASLARLEAVNPKINAFVTVTAEQARAQAQRAEQRLASGEELPPLFGVPVTIKDLADTAGVRTTYGCVAFDEHVPTVDAIAVERLKNAGTIMLGKTTTPEFGLLGVTESKLTGTTSTPWDPTRTSGGSSGGAAASTVAGIAPLALGSDGGGSIRVPSSVCGAVGVKPSTGRIPTIDNNEPDTTDGPITRLVVDAAMMLDVLVGPDPRDRLAIPRTGEIYLDSALAPGDLSGQRIAANFNLNQGPIDPGTRAVFTAALDDLRAAGAVVDEVGIDLPSAIEFFIPYWGPEYILFVDELQQAGIEIWPRVLEVAERSRDLTATEISSTMRQVKTGIYNAYAEIFRTHDLLVTPTTPVPAFPHVGDTGGPEIVDGQRVPHPGGYFHSMTESPSHAGLPALTINCGFTSDGLPVGMQVIGPIYADAAVVSAAARYERATPWHLHHPTL